MGTKNAWRRRVASVAVGALCALAACSGGGGAPTSGTDPATPSSGAAEATTTATAPTTTLPALTDPDPAFGAELQRQLDESGGSCDQLDPSRCLLPFPSEHFTVPDAAASTGLRVAFPAAGMPHNVFDIGIDPSEWNRNDGFSPNTAMLTLVPGLEPTATTLPPWTDPSASLAPESTVAVVDVATGARIPVWAEVDVRPDNPSDRLLVIRPLVVLDEGTRYAVGITGMRSAGGNVIEGSAVFRAYRDRLRMPDAFESRRPAMEEVFTALDAAAMDRETLYLAWAFTTASTRNVSERMLAIRDATLDLLGDSTPEFTVNEVVERPNGDGTLARQVSGTVTVPNFLTGDGSPGNGFYYGPEGEGVPTRPDSLPQQNGTVEAPFTCIVPAVALEPSATGTRIALYGHGLLGSHDEVTATNVRRMAAEHDVLFCATKWAGMSEDDVPNAVVTLTDASNMRTIADRLQQGVLQQIVLGRAMLATNGLFTHSAFNDVVDLRTDRLVFDGNSQGGIMGLMLTAVSPDIERAVLGVPGMNYSLLLPRSVDFDDYEAVMEPAYPNDLDRMLVISLLQMLWDRGEGAGYVRHVTSDPYPGTEAKDVLLHVALGDQQVSPIAAFIEARALGASVHQPLAEPDRLRTEQYAFGLDPIAYPHDGSAIVLWDSGAEEIPLEGVPPRRGRDPHQDPRSDAEARMQKAVFLFDGVVVDVCAGAPCRADRAG